MPDAEMLAEIEEMAGPPTMEQQVVVPPPAGKDKKGNDKKGKDKKGKGAQVLPDGPSIAGHPRAVRSVAMAKAWGALVGFVLGGYLSLPTHTMAAAGVRALIAGAVLYVVAWAVAVFLWRRLVMIEIKAREAQLISAVEAHRALQLTTGNASGERGREGSA